MQKKLLIIVLILISAFGFSQTVQTQGSPNRATHYLGGLQADSTLVVPVRNHDSIYPNLPYKGRVQLNETTNKLEYHNGEEWVSVEPDNDGVNYDLQSVLEQGKSAVINYDSSGTDPAFHISAEDSNEGTSSTITITEGETALGFRAPDNDVTEMSISDGNIEFKASNIPRLSVSNMVKISGQIANYTSSQYFEMGLGSDSSPARISRNSHDTHPALQIYRDGNNADFLNFTDNYVSVLSGVDHQGNFYGPEGTEENHYVTKSQLDEISGTGTSPIAKIDEGNGEGYVIANRNPDNYGAIGLGSSDLSSNPTTDPRGATGDYSFAAGAYTTAHGDYSFAAGVMNTALGRGSTAFGEGCLVEAPNSFAMGSQVAILGAGSYNSAAFGYGTSVSSSMAFATGYYSNASGPSSFASGTFSEAEGASSVAFGKNSIAKGFGSLSIGYNNLPIIENAENGPTEGSPLFIAGNGSDASNRSNAYALFNSGNSTQYGIASYGGDYSSSYNERSLVDKEYVDNLVLEGVTMLKKSASQYSGIVKLSDIVTNNFIWEFPQTDGNLESPTYVIKSISGQQANNYGEVEIGLQSTINYTYSSSIAPVAVNDRLHFYNTPSEALYNFTTFYNYVPNHSSFEPVSGVKFDGRAYGPFAVDNEDYTPLSQVKSMIDSAKSLALELNEDNSAMIFDLGGGSKTSIEALAPNIGVNAILQFPSPTSDGRYRIVTNINGYNADNSGQITIDANGIFNSGAVAVVQDVIDLRSDDGLIFTHSASGNKLEVNGDGIEYNDNLLVDKTTLVNYVASATNISYNAPKSATDLNNTYPGVNEGFIVKCPNAGGIYLKTAVAGQWQFIAATTLNP